MCNKADSENKFRKLGLKIQIDRNHPFTKHLHYSAKESRNHRSQLSKSILSLSGMSNDKVRHFMNNIGKAIDINYLEIGTYTGSTAISFGYGNPVSRITCIDNYSLVPDAYHKFISNIKLYNKFLPRFDIWKRNCWEVDLNKLGKYNIYFYDGDHSFHSQYRAICHFWPVLENTFILIVDDFNTFPVCAGTVLGLNEMKAVIIGAIMLPGMQLKGKKPPKWGWWNGLFAAVVQK